MVVRRPRRRYGSFPTTADVGIWASASTPETLFESLGLALFGQMTDLRKVRPVETRTVRANGPDPGGLTVAYLTELLLLEQADGFLGRSIHVAVGGAPPRTVRAIVRGERFDPGRHAAKIEVKAVTFHQLSVDLDRGRARVILDI